MTALDNGTEAQLSGSDHRRVWARPDVTSHALVVLTPERLYLAPLAGPPEPDRLAAAQYDDLDEVLGPLAVAVDLGAVRRVRLHLPTNALSVEYATADPLPSRVSVTFATSAVADAVFTNLWRRLGAGFKVGNGTRAFWPLARGPLALLVGALLATAALVALVSVFEDAAAGAALNGGAPLGRLDWRWVCGVGGCVAAVAQVWLYRRLTSPPIALELARD